MKVSNKVKAHQRYRNKNGDILPGTTTITGVLAKNALVPWANKLGLQGIAVGKYVDELATIGTLAHYLVEMHLTATKPNLDDYTPNQIELAQKAFKKFINWEKQNNFEFIASEISLVSEEHQFGGCCDIYCKLNDRLTLIDLKTSKAIYSEHFTQVTAYSKLLEENNKKVEDVRILRIGRDDSEGFDDISVPMRDIHWEKFLHCLGVYNASKKLRGYK